MSAINTAFSHVSDFATDWQKWGILVLSGGVAVHIGKTLVNAVFGLGL